jgi:hypothetical protein
MRRKIARLLPKAALAFCISTASLGVPASATAGCWARFVAQLEDCANRETVYERVGCAFEAIYDYVDCLAREIRS